MMNVQENVKNTFVHTHGKKRMKSTQRLDYLSTTASVAIQISIWYSVVGGASVDALPLVFILI